MPQAGQQWKLPKRENYQISFRVNFFFLFMNYFQVYIKLKQAHDLRWSLLGVKIALKIADGVCKLLNNSKLINPMIESDS